MGRVRTKFIKRTAKKIFNKYGSELSTSFDENKGITEKYIDFPSKKLRNVILGYTTRLKKLSKKGQ